VACDRQACRLAPAHLLAFHRRRQSRRRRRRPSTRSCSGHWSGTRACRMGGAEGRQSRAMRLMSAHATTFNFASSHAHAVEEKRFVPQSRRRDRIGPSIEGNLRQGSGNRLGDREGTESTSSLPRLSPALPSPTLAFLCRPDMSANGRNAANRNWHLRALDCRLQGRPRE
jgi:hypothetical protein